VCFAGKASRISQIDVARKAVSKPDLTESGFQKAFIDHYIGRHLLMHDF